MTNDYHDAARIDKTATTFLIRHLRGDPNSPRTIPTNNIPLPHPGCAVLQTTRCKRSRCVSQCNLPAWACLEGMAPVHGIKLCFAFSRTFLFLFSQQLKLQYCQFATLNARSSLDTGIIGPQFPPKYRWRYRCRPTPSETTRTFTRLLYRSPSTDLVIILNQIIIIIEEIRPLWLSKCFRSPLLISPPP